MVRRAHGQNDRLCHHITTRTENREFFLVGDKEKDRIVSSLDFLRKRGEIRIFSYIVMSNHFHVVIEPAEGIQLGNVVRKLKSWTSHNNMSKPPGCPLWEERYDDNRIESADELRSVIAYIHNNPVRAGIVKQPEEYPWSSIHNYLKTGRRAKIEIDCDWWQY